MVTQRDELEASVRELEASLHSAPPEMRPLLEQQIRALREAGAMLERVEPQIAQNRAARAPLSLELAAWFQPVPPAVVPTWIPDDTPRASVTEEWMRPAPGVRVYFDEDSVGCAIPHGPGSVPIREGLGLTFHRSTGRLESQRFYQQGLLRWSVDYHATGGRALVGFYAATERLSYPEHGLITRFSPSGTVVSQQYYDRGVLHGWAKHWEEDGYPIAATLYDGGRAVETVLPDGSRRPG
ncbi:MAG: hypothetical protein IT377_09495 [Polyangiaceae bacterium]|nr:hypothetical protein [Polyangiaceae bacterium]